MALCVFTVRLLTPGIDNKYLITYKSKIHMYNIIYLYKNVVFAGTEWIGPSKRSWGACVPQFFDAVGQCVVAGVIYGIRNWRLVQIIAASPLVVVIIYIWYI